MLPDDADERLTDWLAAEVEPTTTAVAVTRLGGGHSSGAWRVDVTSEGDVGPLVLKAPGEPSPVYRRDAAREARILDATRAPPVRPCPGSSPSTRRERPRPTLLPDGVRRRLGRRPTCRPASYHSDPVLLGSSPAEQRGVWESFHDALAALHRVDPALVPDAALGPPRDGVACSTTGGPRCSTSLPAAPAPPARAARLARDCTSRPAPPPRRRSAWATPVSSTASSAGREVEVLFDFEVAYLGNPAADVGYSLFLDRMQRAARRHPLTGIPARGRDLGALGRQHRAGPAADRGYWTAFGAMVLASPPAGPWSSAASPVDTSRSTTPSSARGRPPMDRGGHRLMLTRAPPALGRGRAVPPARPRRSGAGTSRGSSRSSTSTADRPASSVSASCPTRTGRCCGRSSTSTAGGSASRSPGWPSATSTSRTAPPTTAGACSSAGGPIRPSPAPGSPSPAPCLERTGAERRALGPVLDRPACRATSDRGRAPGRATTTGVSSFATSRLEQTLVADGHGRRRRGRAPHPGRRPPRPLMGAARVAGGLHPGRPPGGPTGSSTSSASSSPAAAAASSASGDGPVEHLVVAEGSTVDYDDDAAHASRAAHLVMEGGATTVVVDLTPPRPERHLRHGPHLPGARALALLPDPRRGDRLGVGHSVPGLVRVQPLRRRLTGRHHRRPQGDMSADTEQR